MNEPIELVLAIRRERSAFSGRTRLVGTLNVSTMRELDEGMMRATRRGEEVYYEDAAEAMRADVERHLQRSFPRDLVYRIERAIMMDATTPPWEAQELVQKLREGATVKVKAVRMPEDRRDECIAELQRDLMAMARRAGKLEEQLRHEQLRGRLFKKGKKKRHG